MADWFIHLSGPAVMNQFQNLTQDEGVFNTHQVLDMHQGEHDFYGHGTGRVHDELYTVRDEFMTSYILREIITSKGTVRYEFMTSYILREIITSKGTVRHEFITSYIRCETSS